VLIAATRGEAVLVVMPLISMALLYGSTRWAIAVTAIYTAEVGALLAHSGPSSVFRGCASFVAAAAFVIVFSRLMRREQLARANVERLASELESANARLREYAAQAEDLATAKERNRLAREVHDSLGHFLTVIHVQIAAAKTHLEGSPELSLECLARAQKLTQEGLADVRRSVALLRMAPTEARPLREAITQLVEECRASGTACDLVVSGAPRALAPPVEFALYRATQESLTNVRRHARATRVDLALAYETESVELRIRDDGVGATTTDGGFGLLGLRERVQLVGGAVEIRTAPGSGFAIEVRVPA
jgi:signal transduction histidine kinase